MKTRVALNEADFRALVAGNTVRRVAANGVTVELILSDIGWGRMIGAVEEAMRGRMHIALVAEPLP